MEAMTEMGFEPHICDLRSRYPKPLDESAISPLQEPPYRFRGQTAVFSLVYQLTSRLHTAAANG